MSACLLASCQPPRSQAPRFEPAGPACAQHQRELVAFVEQLPDRAMPSQIRVELPESIIGEVPGNGALLELGDTFARFEENELAGGTHAERAMQAAKSLQAWQATARAEATRGQLYVAAARTIDVQTLRLYLKALPSELRVRLLVRMPAPAPSSSAADDEARANELVRELLAERDPAARNALSERAFAEFSRCTALNAAVHERASASSPTRWKDLRQTLVSTLPSCRCSDLAPAGLRQIIVAEQRAGAATLAALPLGFLRDERCGASMPLRSLAKLVQQMERFDQEFSGGWQQDALAFEKVLTDERLLNTFCNALPGETLAQLEKSRATLYFKPAGAENCEGWRFEPLSPGAPMGTLHRVADEQQKMPRAFHYWQGAEEIRVFGPLTSSTSKPTDEHEWACDENLRLTAVDAQSVEFERGRWFFSEASCRAATGEGTVFGGCLTKRSEGP